MIERFFDELRRGVLADKATEPPEPDEKLHPKPKADESLLAVIPTVRKIVRRKLFSAARRGDESDLVQKVIVQLLTWRENQPDKCDEMTAQEWQAFASKTTYRAANRLLMSDQRLTEQLDAAAAEDIPSENRVAGNTETEVASLLRMFWQGICQLSLRQRRALLLNSESLVVALKRNGIGNKKLREILELDESELTDVFVRLPLSDAQIARLAVSRSDTKNQNINSLTKSIKKARHEARAKLQKLISE